ncbi:MAG: ABC transporter substrate-binding protein [Actinobacteria bacterium HGW-Actinobacteria-7]|jgi:iron complex transport system substrate-binding protein|nr:MAG: ABC transporter substrate-binding protein [Actinobacteria bacterium HGW-Actinobacteria-7]
MTRTSRTIATLLVLATAAFTAGCAKAATPAPAEKPVAAAPAFPVTITDDASRTVEIAAQPQRIVSLAPANTEILFALGAGDRVVGVTSYDDYPAEVADIAKVGDFAGPNIEAVAAAKPDLVLATTGVQADVIAKLEALGATVIAVDPQNLDALYADIAEIGQATGTTDKASKTVSDMKAQADQIRADVASAEKTTVFVEIAQSPLYTVGSGTIIDELVTIAGGTNVVTESGYVPYSTEQVVKSNPAVYMATKGSMSDPKQLAKRAGFKSLDAVKNGRVIILDDNLVSRPGPRIMEGLKQIAQGLHPDLYSN